MFLLNKPSFVQLGDLIILPWWYNINDQKYSKLHSHSCAISAQEINKKAYQTQNVLSFIRSIGGVSKQINVVKILKIIDERMILAVIRRGKVITFEVIFLCIILHVLKFMYFFIQIYTYCTIIQCGHKVLDTF